MREVIRMQSDGQSRPPRWSSPDEGGHPHAIRGAYHGGPDGAHLMREVIRMQSEGHITEAPMEP